MRFSIFCLLLISVSLLCKPTNAAFWNKNKKKAYNPPAPRYHLALIKGEYVAVKQEDAESLFEYRDQSERYLYAQEDLKDTIFLGRKDDDVGIRFHYGYSRAQTCIDVINIVDLDRDNRISLDEITKFREGCLTSEERGLEGLADGVANLVEKGTGKKIPVPPSAHDILRRCSADGHYITFEDLIESTDILSYVESEDDIDKEECMATRQQVTDINEKILARARAGKCSW